MPSNYKCDHCGHLRFCEETMWGDMFCEDCESMRSEHGGRFVEPDPVVVTKTKTKTKTKCSLCKTEGHNKRTCLIK